MHPLSEARLEQILTPSAISAEPPAVVLSELVEMESIVHPRYAADTYGGPERRAQGYLIAEVLVDSPAIRASGT